MFITAKKYHELGSSIGYTFFLWIFPTLLSYVFFLTDPIIPSMNILIKLTCLIGLVIAPILGGHSAESNHVNDCLLYTSDAADE